MSEDFFFSSFACFPLMSSVFVFFFFFVCVCISSGQQKGVNQKAPRSTAALKYAHTRS